MSEDGNGYSPNWVKWAKAPHRIRRTKSEDVLLFCNQHKRLEKSIRDTYICKQKLNAFLLS